MLLSQAKGAGAVPSGAGGGVTVWAMSQAVPFLMRKAAGRVLVWVWKADPELVVAMAQVQAATPQLRVARASMPIEYDDTEEFRGTYLGVGEKLAMPLPPGGHPPFATYTWDIGSHFVSVTACAATVNGSAPSSELSMTSRAASASSTISLSASRRRCSGSTPPDHPIAVGLAGLLCGGHSAPKARIASSHARHSATNSG